MTRQVRAVLAVLVVCAVVAVMVRLSWWQWGRARESGRFLNYTYAVEWLLFAVLTVVGVIRLALEDRHRPDDPMAGVEEAAPSPLGVPVPMVGPPLRPGEELEEITWVRLRRRLGLGDR